MNGLELSRRYYMAFGEPMLREQFAEWVPYLAVGLCGAQNLLENGDFTTRLKRLPIPAGWDMQTSGDCKMEIDKTVTYKRKFVPGYMHKILQSWHEKGLHTLQEIQSESRRPFGGNSPGGTASGQEPVSPEHLWGIVDEI